MNRNDEQLILNEVVLKEESLKITEEYIEKIKENIRRESEINSSDDLLKEIEKIPQEMRFKELHKIIKDKIDKDFNRRKLLYCIEKGLLPQPKKEAINQSTYSKEHLLLYILISSMKNFLGLDEIGKLLKVLQPNLRTNGPIELLTTYFKAMDYGEELISSNLKDMINDFSKLTISNINKNEENFKRKEYLKNKYEIDVLVTIMLMSLGVSFIKSSQSIVQEYINDEKKLFEITKILEEEKINN